MAENSSEKKKQEYRYDKLKRYIIESTSYIGVYNNYYQRRKILT